MLCSKSLLNVAHTRIQIQIRIFSLCASRPFHCVSGERRMVSLGLSVGRIRRGRQFIENFLFNERKIVCVVRAARNSPCARSWTMGLFDSPRTHTLIIFIYSLEDFICSFEKGSSPLREPQSSSITSEHNKTLILIIDYNMLATSRTI